MVYGKHDTAVSFIRSVMNCTQSDKNRKMEVVGTPLYNQITGS